MFDARDDEELELEEDAPPADVESVSWLWLLASPADLARTAAVAI